jgi:histidyl-tRNA synthetase
VRALRGIRDYSPDDYSRLEGLRSIFLELAKVYGFRMMEPAPMETLETLEEKSGPAIRDEIYYFKDKGGRDLGLRFDLTVGMTRYACADRAAPLPIKLGAFAGVWRYDEPQHARYRWFYQWDVETYGSRNPESDCEMIEFTSHLLQKAGVRNHIVKIGDRRLVQEFIEKKLGYRGEKAVELMRALDKVDKKSRKQLVEEYSKKGFSTDALLRMLDFGETEGSPDVMLAKLNEESLKSAEHLAELRDQLQAGRAKIGLSVKIVRGIDYYTSTVYEAFDLDRPGLGALAGGGRYDLLPSIFGRPDLVATGVAGGAERLMMSLEGTVPWTLGGRPVYVAYTGGMTKEAMAVASTLRHGDIGAIVDLQRRSLSKQLEDAARVRAKLVVIVGPREHAEGEVVVRDMDTRQERRVSMGKLVDELSKDVGR